MENGRTASACYVVQLVVVFDGFGTQKITSGLRYTPTCKNDGSMSMHAKNRGTIRDYTLKGGVRKCLIVSHFL